MNLGFYLFASGVNQGGMKKGGEFKISFCHPRGLRASTQTYREQGGMI